MGLALSVIEGGRVFINDKPMTVITINGTEGEVEYQGVRHKFTVAVAAFVESDVKVSLGVNHQNVVRLVIDAPKHITILREKLYGNHAAGKN